MKGLFFLWIAVLLQPNPATPEQIHEINRSWNLACLERGGELRLNGSYRVWNGKEAFLVEGRCEATTDYGGSDEEKTPQT